MSPDDARRLEQWFALQLRAMPGGYEGACSMPDSPISADTLSKASRGLRRVTLGDALYLASVNGRADLLRALADRIDSEAMAESLSDVSRTSVHDAASLDHVIADAERDGRYSAAEVHDIRQAAAKVLRDAQAVTQRAEALRPGPVAVPGTGYAV